MIHPFLSVNKAQIKIDNSQLRFIYFSFNYFICLIILTTYFSVFFKQLNVSIGKRLLYKQFIQFCGVVLLYMYTCMRMSLRQLFSYLFQILYKWV